MRTRKQRRPQKRDLRTRRASFLWNIQLGYPLKRTVLGMGTSPAAKLAVIGTGLAASALVRTLRAGGYQGHITAYTEQPIPGYDKPPLSKNLLEHTQPVWLAQEIDADLPLLVDELHLGEKVLRVGATQAWPATSPQHTPPVAADAPVTPYAGGFEVTTANTTTVFDQVHIATGSQPVRPTWAGESLVLNTWADALAIRGALQRTGQQQIVIIGAGWIGMELASVLASAGHRVSVVETGQVPLQQSLGLQVGQRTLAWLAAAQVEFLGQHTVSAVLPQQPANRGHAVPLDTSPPPGYRVELSDGSSLPATVVICAVGARPDLTVLDPALSQHLHFSPTAAVLTDALGRPVTPSREVIATTLRFSGDVAAPWREPFGFNPGGHWDAALQTGVLAAQSMLGELQGQQVTPPPHAPYVFSKQFGHDLGMFGSPDPAAEVVFHTPPDAAGWLAAWIHPHTQQVSAILGVDLPRQVAAARRFLARDDLPVLDGAQFAAAGIPRHPQV